MKKKPSVRAMKKKPSAPVLQLDVRHPTKLLRTEVGHIAKIEGKPFRTPKKDVSQFLSATVPTELRGKNVVPSHEEDTIRVTDWEEFDKHRFYGEGETDHIDAEVREPTLPKHVVKKNTKRPLDVDEDDDENHFDEQPDRQRFVVPVIAVPVDSQNFSDEDGVTETRFFDASQQRLRQPSSARPNVVSPPAATPRPRHHVEQTSVAATPRPRHIVEATPVASATPRPRQPIVEATPVTAATPRTRPIVEATRVASTRPLPPSARAAPTTQATAVSPHDTPRAAVPANAVRYVSNFQELLTLRQRTNVNIVGRINWAFVKKFMDKDPYMCL